MVGEGPLKQPMLDLIAELGLEDVIRLEGHAPQDAINDYYSAADVYVFPSLMETWGLAAVEAMLCGCPVVGTFAVMPEVVPDYAGIYVPSHEPADLAEGLERAIGRDWDRDAIREFALGYDWKIRVDGFDSLYRRVLARR
jgi:glycosyltransferase involved in cell wall biosynthesis